MNLIKVISSAINTGKRIIKLYRMGLKDVQTAVEVSPHGIDSSPVKDTVGIYASTTTKGNTYVLGYINRNQKAAAGELRTYSTNTTGVEQFYTWLKSDGTYELGGVADNAVRYSPVAASVNEIKTDINNLKTILNSWAPVPNDGGAALKIALGSYISSTLTEDISAAKIDEIKTL